MIEEADFQKIGNAAIDLCVFVEKLRLGEKHRKEADKLTHNILNLIRQTGKIKEEPLTKGNKMNKKLKIRFVKFEKALAMQILEQEGRFRDSEHVCTGLPELCCDRIYLCDEEERGNLDVSAKSFVANSKRDEYLKTVIRWISKEQFGESMRELKVGEMCEVRNSGTPWVTRKLIAILPGQYKKRFIAESQFNDFEHFSCNEARPLSDCIEPKIDGDVYTWEEK